jgi:uncharacterized protein (TIGR04255 family)
MWTSCSPAASRLFDEDAFGKKYRNPPIREAVCELRIVAGTPWDLAIPGMIYDRLKRSFPKRRQLKTVEASLIGGAVRMQESERLQFLQEDERTLIMVGKDVLSVTRLKSYLGWEAFLPLILETFEAYKEITTPTGFQRLGLRYINQIDFKEERLKLEDFFDFYPYVGKQLPQDHGAFFTGIQPAYEEGRDALRLQFASAEAASGFRLSFILDLNRTTRHWYTQAASCEYSPGEVVTAARAWTAAVTSGV